MDYETAWQFETAKFRTELRIYPCIDDPADSFDDEHDIASLRNGDVAWFDAVVAVVDKASGRTIGRDSLGGCAYRDIDEFITSHRDRDAANRNTLEQKSQNRVICHYFPSMVTEAVRDARQSVRRLCDSVRHG